MKIYTASFGQNTENLQFQEGLMLLANACMHLLDNTGIDIEALKQLRYAQRRMTAYKKVKEVEEKLDGSPQVSFSSVNRTTTVFPSTSTPITLSGATYYSWSTSPAITSSPNPRK